MSERFTFDRQLLIRVFFFATFAFLIYQTFLLAKPFMAAILVAGLLAIMFFPLCVRLRKLLKNDALAALIMTLGVVLAAILPLAWLGWFLFREADQLIPAVQNITQSLNSGNLTFSSLNIPPFLQSFVTKILSLFERLEVDLRPIMLQAAQSIGSRITSFGALIAKNAVFTFFKTLLLIFSLFFAFKDGDKFLKWFLTLIPMEPAHKQVIAKRAIETFKAVTIGVFLTAAAQGITAMIGFLVSGHVNLPVLLGIATGIASLLGASFIITLPTAFIVFRESMGWGIFLFIWGAVVVGFMDNVLKPVLIGSRARMPFVLIFFSILGGIKMYGLLGLIVGPVLIASVLTFVKIYREAYDTNLS